MMTPISILAAARTPWLRRHGQLANQHPADIVAAVLTELVVRAQIDPSAVARIIVCCATPVGAQSLNIARTAALAAGFPLTTPAITVDGQGIGAAEALSLLASGGPALPPTIVAAVDLTSVVPPGAGTVRDYGAPHGPLLAARVGSLDAPGPQADQLASRLGIERHHADAEARRQLALPPAPLAALIHLATADDMDDLRELPDDSVPLFADDGACSAINLAEPADGAAAVLVAGSAADALSTVVATTSGAQPAEQVEATVACIDAVQSHSLEYHNASLALADAAAVRQLATMRLLGHQPAERLTHAGVLSNGTVPSADLLRLVVDATFRQEPTVVAGPGALGQAAAVGVTPGSRSVGQDR